MLRSSPELQQIREPTRVQALVPQLPVETFHVRVLHPPSRFDVHELDPPTTFGSNARPARQGSWFAPRDCGGRPDKLRGSDVILTNAMTIRLPVVVLLTASLLSSFPPTGLQNCFAQSSSKPTDLAAHQTTRATEPFDKLELFGLFAAGPTT